MIAKRKTLMKPNDNADVWACSLAWIGRQSPKLQIAGSNPARSVKVNERNSYL
ncbi:MAG: hypothetical protein H6P94_608 [Thermoplasmatales archaeon]|nr:hypothetical protein [Thermoplasmatales archaeon]